MPRLTRKSPAVFYAITFGLAGCYLPDSHDGAHSFATRAELALMVRALLEQYELPRSLFADVHIRRLWKFLKQRGSSSAHFSLIHNGYSLSFHGLTEEEFAQADAENDY